MTHEVKILPAYFQAVWDRKKTFEVRKNDRDYQPDDILILKEWDGKKFTGSVVTKKICYMLTDIIDGIEAGYCVIGLEDI